MVLSSVHTHSDPCTRAIPEQTITAALLLPVDTNAKSYQAQYNDTFNIITMNAAAQKRMLTGPKSKLAKLDIEVYHNAYRKPTESRR